MFHFTTTGTSTNMAENPPQYGAQPRDFAVAMAPEQPPACAMCTSQASKLCANCTAPMCNIHATAYTQTVGQSGNVITMDTSDICTTCHELYKIVDFEMKMTQLCGLCIIISAIVAFPAWIFYKQNPFRLWVTRSKRKFREYNAEVSPVLPIKITKGSFTCIIYPHSDARFADSQGESAPLIGDQKV